MAKPQGAHILAASWTTPSSTGQPRCPSVGLLRKWFRLQAIMVAMASSLVGCEEVDPRCENLCTIQNPDIDGAFDVCSQDSADLCKRLCMARIKGQGTLCQSCLLEGAMFSTDAPPTYTIKCSGTICTITTSSQSTCDYFTTSEDSRQRCFRQLFPRKDVACMPRFQSVGFCLPVCSGAPASPVPQPSSPTDLGMTLPVDSGPTMDLAIKG